MATVTLDRVGKTYANGFEAVKGVSLDIEDGEFLVLVGPSGCGKSTTLRMVAGLETVSDGTIRIGDRVVNDVAPKDRDIAMVFQNYALYPHMTVGKNLGFALKLRGTPRREIDKRVGEVAEMLGLSGMLERRPGQLSGGQRQRVAVGRAIVREPAVYLFDEPLSNLDAKLRASMRTELKSLHRRLRTTTIYVTHDQEEAMTLGDRIVVMDGGEIRQAGPPLDVYRAPTSRFVASFIGSPHMNFFAGAVRRENGRCSFAERASGEAGAVELELPGELSPGGSALPDGTAVTLGVRPQHISLAPGREAGDAVRVTVASVDPLGEEMDVVFRTASNEHAIARMRHSADIRAGETVSVRIDPGRVHVFENTGGGARITRA